MIGPYLSPRARAARRSRARGFTLVEVLVVVGIIAITSAVALPNISGYMRASRIRAANDMVSGALQKARTMAIMRNTQMGITFVVESNTVFWVHIEDTIAGVSTGDVGFTRQGIDFDNPTLLVSSRFELPSGVEFAATSADCPDVSGFTPANASLRFDRFGLSVIPPASGATAVVLDGGSTTTNRVYVPAAGDRAVCLIDRNTSLRRWILIGPGGGLTRG